MLFFVTLGIGFGAVNSGNNLLYLVLGVMLSLIMVSGVLSELTLRGLTVIRASARHLECGQPALVAMEIHNHKRRFASLSVEVSELLETSSGIVQRRAFVLKIPVEDQVTAHLRLQPEKRGVYRSAGLQLTTRFPFGLFEKSRVIPLPGRYTVTPQLRPLESTRLPARVAGHEEEIARVGQGDEFYALRDALVGDDARAIAWKVTARRDKLIVREQQRPATRRVLLLFPNALPEQNPATRARFEMACSEVASLACVYIDEGYSVGLLTSDGGVPPASGSEAFSRILNLLASLPVRYAPAGTKLPLAEEVITSSATDRVVVLTVEQQRAAYPIDADMVRVVTGEADGDQEGDGEPIS
jgi:uncharacterized protein (DUF58 family)